MQYLLPIWAFLLFAFIAPIETTFKWVGAAILVYAVIKVLTEAIKAGAITSTHSYLEIVEEEPHRLVLKSNRGTMIVDATRKIISRNGKKLASFDRIKFVDVTRERESGETMEWRVDLYIGPLRKIRVGETRDDVQAAIIGARLTTILDVDVLAWKENDHFRW